MCQIGPPASRERVKSGLIIASLRVEAASNFDKLEPCENSYPAQTRIQAKYLEHAVSLIATH